MASRPLDLLATQRRSGHDEGVAEPDADATRSRCLRRRAARPELFLAVPDEVVQDAGVRWKHHRLNTVPSSDHSGLVRKALNQGVSYDETRMSSTPSDEFGRTHKVTVATMQP